MMNKTPKHTNRSDDPKESDINLLLDFPLLPPPKHNVISDGCFTININDYPSKEDSKKS